MNNPFNLLYSDSLSSSSSEEEEEAPKKVVVQYKVSTQVTLGLQRVSVPLLEASGMAARGGGGLRTTPSATFYGRCYKCSYTAHSQKHCPLVQCATCHAWGHDKSACQSSRSSSSNKSWVMPAADRLPKPSASSFTKR